jgi:putative addiction module killer protein
MKYELKSTEVFEKWLSKVKDRSGKIKILARLDRIQNGNFGDCKQIGKELYELRFFFGPGYRVYYTIKNNSVVILLAGGDKASQTKNIEKAKMLLNELEE